MKYIEGVPRDQIHLFSTTLEEMVEQDNPVRFIDAYIDQLDLGRHGFRVVTNETGRPPYRSSLLLKIYIYCYLNRIRSSRRIQREVKRNIELKWLAQSLEPDFHTIAEFRRINHKAIRGLFREFLTFCWKLKLVTLETIGIDGTKLRGQNNVMNVLRRDTIAQVERKIDEKIDEYLQELDKTDNSEYEIELDRGKIEKRITTLKQQRDKIEKAKSEFKGDKDRKAIFTTDADVRMMNDKGSIRPGYNAQIAVDAKNKLLVSVEVTNEASDRTLMTLMLQTVQKVKDEFNVTKKTTAEMDAGYHSEEAVLTHKDSESFDIVVPSQKDSPKPQQKKSIPHEDYRSDAFTYNRAGDCFTCPPGQRLSVLTETKARGKNIKTYQCEDANSCSVRDKCTRNKQGRTITITENHEIMEQFRAKMKTAEYIKRIKERKELCEHPFGTMKRSLDFDYFLLRGLNKVKSEFSFMCLIYNIKRVITIIGIKELMLACNR